MPTPARFLPTSITLVILVGMGKRGDILGAAEDLFYRRGFHATPVDDVVRAAGVTPRTLYRHFPSKAELAVEVLRARDARFLGWLEERVVESVGEGRHPVLALFDALEGWVSRFGERGCMFLRALGEEGVGGEGVLGVVSGHKRGYREVVARVTGLGDEEAAEVVLLLEGAVAMSQVVGVEEAFGVARRAAARIAA